MAAHIEGEIMIGRTPGEVFDFVSDQCNEPIYNPQMLSAKKLTDGAPGAGSRFEAVMRQGRRTFPITITFTAFERPTRLGSFAEMEGMSTEGVLTFEQVGDSTLMRWSWQINTKGVLRLLSPLVTWMGRRQEQRIWTSLKRHLETGS